MAFRVNDFDAVSKDSEWSCIPFKAGKLLQGHSFSIGILEAWSLAFG